MSIVQRRLAARASSINARSAADISIWTNRSDARAARRGGPERHAISLEEFESTNPASLTANQRADLLVSMDEALERLSALDERQARVVECRFFGGMTEGETADSLGVTERTVARDWVKARGWLFQELSDVDT